MAYIHTTPVNEAKGAVHEMYARQQQSLGYVPNYAKVFCHRPEVMGDWAALLAGIRRHMDARRFELVTFAAAHARESSYCTLAHGKALHDDFFSAEEVTAIARDPNAGPLSEAEAAMMAFAQRLARRPASITNDDVEALRAHGLSDAEIFDVAAAVAARCFFATLLDGVGALPDAIFGEMDPELAEALTVGRPIETGTT